MRCGEYGMIFDSQEERERYWAEIESIRNNPIIMFFLNTFIGSWLMPIIQKGNDMPESERNEYARRILEMSSIDKQGFWNEVANAKQTHPWKPI